jgi:hypothetical protein
LLSGLRMLVFFYGALCRLRLLTLFGGPLQSFCLVLLLRRSLGGLRQLMFLRGFLVGSRLLQLLLRIRNHCVHAAYALQEAEFFRSETMLLGASFSLAVSVLLPLFTICRGTRGRAIHYRNYKASQPNEFDGIVPDLQIWSADPCERRIHCEQCHYSNGRQPFAKSDHPTP